MTQLFDLAAQLTECLPPVRVSTQMAQGIEIASRRAGCRKTSEYVRGLILADLSARGILTQEVDIEQSEK